MAKLLGEGCGLCAEVELLGDGCALCPAAELLGDGGALCTMVDGPVVGCRATAVDG